ncbi:hypothetical protein Hanom_Chr14g01292751 [Helianthus anomalus]
MIWSDFRKGDGFMLGFIHMNTLLFSSFDYTHMYCVALIYTPVYCKTYTLVFIRLYTNVFSIHMCIVHI